MVRHTHTNTHAHTHTHTHARSLTKEVSNRPKFHQLMDDPFIKRTEREDTDVGAWFRDILERESNHH